MRKELCRRKGRHRSARGKSGRNFVAVQIEVGTPKIDRPGVTSDVKCTVSGEMALLVGEHSRIDSTMAEFDVE
jgi:hypothetical protein